MVTSRKTDRTIEDEIPVLVDIVESLDDRVLEFITKHKKVLRRHVENNFKLSQSGAEKILSRLVKSGRVSVLKNVRIKDIDQYRNVSVFYI